MNVPECSFGNASTGCLAHIKAGEAHLAYDFCGRSDLCAACEDYIAFC